jgi:hypothetical protein
VRDSEAWWARALRRPMPARLGCFRAWFIALGLSLLVPGTIHSAEAASPPRADTAAGKLRSLVFDPVGEWVRAHQRFGALEQCNFYTEGQDAFNVLGSAPYLYDAGRQAAGPSRTPHPPPLGMRSAVPLGGLGTGSVELRADGRFHDWLIENGGPGLSEHGKIPLKEEMLLGLHVGGVSRVLTTQAPGSLRGVDGLRYGGAFPVSRLEIEDQELPVEAELYAYSAFEPYDAKASGVPSITFSLLVRNPGNTSVTASFSIMLPLFQEKDQSRMMQTSGVIVAVSDLPRARQTLRMLSTLLTATSKSSNPRPSFPLVSSRKPGKHLLQDQGRCRDC